MGSGLQELVARGRLNVRSVALPRWSVYAWSSIATVALFLAITFWWLANDSSIPVFDAGFHLSQTINLYHHVIAGEIGTGLDWTSPYPPLAFLVGALGLSVGGYDVASPIVAENLVFVPLLALGCYRTAKIAFGPRAGLLAVVFALGSPLLIAQFHVFMLDAPETAMVAVSVWLILASRRFSRVRVCAAAGVAVGLGLLTKEPFVFFVAGLVAVSAVRAGWRACRGLAVFGALAFAVAAPWYIDHFARVNGLASASVHSDAVAANGIAPPDLSIANLQWYFWNLANAQLYVPLLALALAGIVWALAGLARRRPVSPVAPELLLGGFVAWLALTFTFVHDTRYSMPLIPYLAVFAAGLAASLRRPAASVAGASAIAMIALANTFGASFGAGSDISATLPGAEPSLLEYPGLLRFFSNSGFLVAAPHRDGDLLGLMRTLKLRGARQVTWVNIHKGEGEPFRTYDFSESGLEALALLAGLEPAHEGQSFAKLNAKDVVLGHGRVTPGESQPCVRLSDGTGVWVRWGNPYAPTSKSYCPFRRPEFY